MAAAGVAAGAAIVAGAVLVAQLDRPNRTEPSATAVIASAPLAPAPPPQAVSSLPPSPPAAPDIVSVPIPAPMPPPAAEEPRTAGLRPPPLRDPGQSADRLPKVALIIDDVGLSSVRTERTIALPPPITLAFLPYGRQAPELAASALAAGHEILLHLPMEPEDDSINPGPNALMLGLSDDELERRIAWNLERISGYVGVNNHMGSRFTQSAPAMRKLMAALRRRDLLFIDSVTTNRSVGVAVAREHGVATAGRDVFLDTMQEPAAVLAQLREVERIARQDGQVIAIGHPYPVTLDALERWLPLLSAKGLRLVPVSALARVGAEG